jgi:hypothetical protein
LSADGEGEEQRRLETLEFLIEHFKHLTKVSVAVAMVILAIYRERIAKETAQFVTLTPSSGSDRRPLADLWG